MFERTEAVENNEFTSKIVKSNKMQFCGLCGWCAAYHCASYSIVWIGCYKWN